MRVRTVATSERSSSPPRGIHGVPLSVCQILNSARSREAVLQEILDCAGTQFDAELAPLFVRLDFNEYDRLFAEHSAKEKKSMLDKDEAA